MSGARGLTDLERRWSLRALLHHRVATPQLCQLAVERAQLIPTRAHILRARSPRSLVAHVALTGSAAGITLGRRIYITQDLFDERGGAPLQLVVHEVAHVAQYMRDGRVGFLARYLADYASGLARGLSDVDAYLAIPHEVEAREVDSYVAAHARDEELAAVARVLY